MIIINVIFSYNAFRVITDYNDQDYFIEMRMYW